MKIYQVGGSVRDLLMGVPCSDLDYVVVGATAEQMLHKGFKQVGADFPVYLHPETGAEYALARTERKTAVGHLGFSVQTQGVTLEEDLFRRDLTINAMALSPTGEVIDPYGGQSDLTHKILRHVGPAFEEDPVRVLRIARFLARFGTPWCVHPHTLVLCRNMVKSGELNSLVAERVWKEMSRLLMEPHPGKGLTFLNEVNFFKTEGAYLFKSCDTTSIQKLEDAPADLSLWGKTLIAVNGITEIRLAEVSAFPSGLYKTKQSFDCLAAACRTEIPADRLTLLEKAGVLRKSDESAAAFKLLEVVNSTKAKILRKEAHAVTEVSSKNFDFKNMNGQDIKKILFEARLAAMKTV